ncbi:hypothetical protein D3C79_178230 [compost metagenome]
MRRHATHLAISALEQGDFQPGGGDRLAFADRWVARPQPFRLAHQLHAGRQSGAIFERNAAAQRRQIGFLRRAFHLGVIHFAGAFARLGKLRLQLAVIGQHQ